MCRSKLYVLQGNLRPKKNAHMIAQRRDGTRFIRNASGNVASWNGFILQARAMWTGLAICEDTIIRVVFYRDSERRVDTSNLVSAFSDILEAAGVCEDDRFLHVWPYPVRVDKVTPRVEWWIDNGALVDMWADQPSRH